MIAEKKMTSQRCRFKWEKRIRKGYFYVLYKIENYFS